MRRSSQEEVRGDFRADVDRITPRTIGAEIVVPFITGILAVLFIALAAAVMVRVFEKVM